MMGDSFADAEQVGKSKIDPSSQYLNPDVFFDPVIDTSADVAIQYTIIRLPCPSIENR